MENQQEEVKICDKCGGTMSRNPNKKQPNHPDWICNQNNGKCGRTGKKGWFATGAWDEPFQTNVANAKVQQQSPPLQQNGTVPPEVWEAKDRMHAMQTAINAASEIYQGSGEIEKAMQDALKFYDLLRQAKQGTIPRYKAPVSKAGKLVAHAMGEVIQ